MPFLTQYTFDVPELGLLQVSAGNIEDAVYMAYGPSVSVSDAKLCSTEKLRPYNPVQG